MILRKPKVILQWISLHLPRSSQLHRPSHTVYVPEIQILEQGYVAITSI